ncbi:MAG TPA: DUF4278 domain-containing protein [Candidatus Obscuribacterales bacterium]
MKLSYRGASYQYDVPTLEVTETEIYGKYRGQNSSSRYVRHIPLPPPVPDLNGSEVAYHTAQPAAQSWAKITEPTFATRKNIEKVLDEATMAHLANIRRSLEHRLNVAKANGDQALLRQLEAESAQIVVQA